MSSETKFKSRRSRCQSRCQFHALNGFSIIVLPVSDEKTLLGSYLGNSCFYREQYYLHIYTDLLLTKLEMVFLVTKSSHLRCSMKIGVLKNFVKFTGKHLCQSLFFNKEEALVQVFSCEFCEIFRNTFFDTTPLVAASVLMRQT